MNKWIQLTLLLFPAICTAECIEFKIVDHGSYVEAVCIGKPLTHEERRKIEIEIQQRDLEIATQQASQRDAQKRNEDAIKLSRTDCTKTSECGPGRVCVGFVALGVGVCKETDAANRIVEQANRNAEISRANQARINQEHENTKLTNKINDLERNLKQSKDAYEQNRMTDKMDKIRRDLYR